MCLIRTTTLKKSGFGLIELAVALVVLAVILALTVPIMTDLVGEYRGRVEMQRCQEVIMKTASESLLKNLPSQVVVAGDTITGQIIETNGDLTQVARYQLAFGSFGRDTDLATPWLGSQETSATNYDGADNTIPFNGFGVLSHAAGEPDGAVVIYSNRGNVSVIEILQSGLVEIFHHGKGEQTWVQ